MRIEHLVILVEIVKQNSMKAASEQLFMTPQALSSAVKSLEEELNVQIFLRSNKGISVTEKGRVVIKFAESTVKKYHQMLSTLGDEESFDRFLDGNLTIYAAPVFYEFFLPTQIERYKSVFENVSVALIQRSVKGIAKFFDGQNINPSVIGAMVLPADAEGVIREYLPTDMNNIDYKVLSRNHYLACVSKESSLARQKTVSIKKLLEFPFVDYCAGDLGSSSTVGMLKQYKSQLNISVSVSSFSVWAKSIESNLGVGIMNAAFLEPEFALHELLDNVKLLTINEPLVSFNCLMYYKNPSDCVNVFLQQFKTYNPKKNDPAFII